MDKLYAIIVAGGSGTRMGSDIPKQYLEINNCPIIIHTLQRFYQFNSNIHFIICVHHSYVDHVKLLIDSYFSNLNFSFALSGDTRTDTVKNGLACIQEPGIVMIHDAVRPFIEDQLLIEGIKLTQQFGNAIPCIEVKESIRELTTTGNKAVARSNYRLIQTPQFFKSSILLCAYGAMNEGQEYTDDASVVESYGEKITLFMGTEKNIKITYPQDLKLAALLLSSSSR